jgi:hypothetical protein
MTEDFLHFIWKYKLYNNKKLKLTDNTPIEILEHGFHNTDSGPDFFNARIKIGQTIWAGNIEIHVNSSDWYKHKHNIDKSYDNIILHVVYHHDRDIFRINGELIPTLELSFNPDLFYNYNSLLSSNLWISCQNQIHEVEEIFILHWLEKLAIERLNNKADYIKQGFEITKNNISEVFYRQLSRNFGMKTNAEPFELVAKSVSYNILQKHKGNLFQIESMLFGQAGFLNDNLNDDYYLALKKEYEFLKKKYNLIPVQSHLWKFLRLRPMNFPTVRIAQLAALINSTENLFSKIIEKDYDSIIEIFINIKVSDYWYNHYNFGKNSVKKVKAFSIDFINNIIINTIVPFIFIYGHLKDEQREKDRAVVLLEKIPSEDNSVIKKWSKIGIYSKNALFSQALIQLKRYYCDTKNCLNCEIGCKIITKPLMNK